MLLATSDQAVSSQGQAVSRLLGASRRQTHRLEHTSEAVSDKATPLGHANNGKDVARRLDVAQLARQRPVPGRRIRAVSQILVVQHLKARVLDGVESLLDLAHVGNAITLLDSEADLTVVKVVVVVIISHEPLVDTKDTTGLEHTEDFAIDALEGGGMDGGLDGIDSIEAVVGKGHLHKVTLDKVELLGQTLLGSVVGGAVNLVIIVVQAGDMAAGELGNLAGRAADTAANIEHSHTLLDANAVGEVVLVTGNGLVEWLAGRKAAEVERLAPAVLVEVGRKVVVAIEGLAWFVSTVGAAHLKLTVW